MTDTGVQAPATPRRERAAQQTEQPKQRQIQRCPKSSIVLEHESVSPNGRAVWYARVPHEHTIEDVLDPNYFGGLQLSYGGLKAGDLIDIEPESALWRTQVRVMASVPAISQVRTREAANMRQSYHVKAPDGYRFEWRGGVALWTVVKSDTEALIAGGFASQDEAHAHITSIS